MTSLPSFQSAFFLIGDEQGITIARLTKPQLTEDENLEQLEQDLNALIETYQVRRLVLSLERLNYLTSSAIGKLISLHRRMQRVDGRLILCAAGDDVRQILDTAHLWTYFNVASNVEEAVLQLAS